MLSFSRGLGQSPSFNIRQAVTADAQRIGEVHVSHWRTGMAGYIDASFLESLKAGDVTMQWLRSLASPLHADTLVAEDEEGGVVGVIDFGINQNQLGYDVAEIFGLYVDPDSWYRGIDSELLRAAELHLAESGFSSIIVWTLSGSDNRRQFYEDAGWTDDGVEEPHYSGALVARYSRQL